MVFPPGRAFFMLYSYRAISFRSRFIIRFFQPRDIRLGNPEKIRDFFLRFLPPLWHIDAKPEFHDHLLPLRELADCASQHAMFRLLLEP